MTLKTCIVVITVLFIFCIIARVGLVIQPSSFIKVLAGSTVTLECVSLVPSVPAGWVSENGELGPSLTLTNLQNEFGNNDYACEVLTEVSPFPVGANPSLEFTLLVFPGKND